MQQQHSYATMQKPATPRVSTQPPPPPPLHHQPFFLNEIAKPWWFFARMSVWGKSGQLTWELVLHALQLHAVDECEFERRRGLGLRVNLGGGGALWLRLELALLGASDPREVQVRDTRCRDAVSRWRWRRKKKLKQMCGWAVRKRKRERERNESEFIWGEWWWWWVVFARFVRSLELVKVMWK